MPEKSVAVVRTQTELCAATKVWRDRGQTIGLVPTMGALHDGHLSLVRSMREQADRVLVTIFVNPTQFAPDEDFDSYPRNENQDRVKLAKAGATLVYIPGVQEIYPNGPVSAVKAPLVGVGLCDASRMGHFDGVASVVSTLLEQCRPDLVIFGEKDFQQLKIIERLVADNNIPVKVIAAPIVRDKNGLALSSRNNYLSASQYQIALALPRALNIAARAAPGRSDLNAIARSAKETLIKAGFDAVDYVEFRHSHTLEPVTGTSWPVRLLAAARIGKIRLIDNVEIEGPERV
jgi:pantoate--beta-alanine ligase